MKSYQVFLVLLVLSCPLFAQERRGTEKPVTKHPVDSSDLCRFAEQVPRLYREGKIDSVRMILNYQEGKCLPLRARILLAIDAGTFRESVYDEEIINSLLYHKLRMTALRDTVRHAWRSYWYPSIQRFEPFLDFYPEYNEYDFFVTSLAQSLLIRQRYKNELERLFCEFYSGEVDSMFIKLPSRHYHGTRLQTYFLQYANVLLSEFNSHLAFFGAAWMPQGKNKVLGNHPVVGGLLGGKKNKFLFGLAFELRFLKTSEPYAVRQADRLVYTRHYLGTYLGIEGGRELARTNRHEIDLISGVGWDWFAARAGENRQDGKSINSLNLNLGLGYRYYLKKYGLKYIGFELRHNWLNYATGGGTDLSGNALTLRVIYGIFGNSRANEVLEGMGYAY